MNNFSQYLLIVLLFLLSYSVKGQESELRGFVFDADDGTPIEFVYVTIPSENKIVYTDANGYYSFGKIESKEYEVIFYSAGYDSVVVKIDLTQVKEKRQNVYLKQVTSSIDEVQVTADEIKKKTKVLISQVQVNIKDIERLPAFGGESDLLQYLQVLPGAVFTGDQGGQLYLRGGAPVMNRVLLDGMVIYNPFHSIGLYSVFDGEILQSAEVYSAGFGAEYGGRISGVIDVKTKDGNSEKFSGLVSISPVVGKVVASGPLKRFKQNAGSSSYLISYRNSYINQTDNIFYNNLDQELPFSFEDLYAKLSFKSPTGSYSKLFGFNFTDKAQINNTSNYKWDSRGFGGQFLILPQGSKTLIKGALAYTNYEMTLEEAGQSPRSSAINGFNTTLEMNTFVNNDELRVGAEIIGFSTDFEFFNAVNRRIEQVDNNTELGLYGMWKKIINKRFILEPSLRIQFYASLQETVLEPRLRAKFLMTEKIRLKFAAGIYSQNLMSAVSDRDVVNLFYGFLSSPDELPEDFRGQEVKYNYQKAQHAVIGLEVDIAKNLDLNIEGYVKDFNQITNINRDKIFDNSVDNQNVPYYLRGNYIVEDGLAYGGDVTLKFEYDNIYLWTVYSLNWVTRRDEIRDYRPHFDRRHNVNLLASYNFGKNESFAFNIRWNFGSGFPFTQTQNFYPYLDFNEGIDTDYLTENGEIGIEYADINQGQLPYFHRLDASISKKFYFLTKENGLPNKDKQVLELNFSVVNIYNRDNIFYFDRLSYNRVNQLPFLPALALKFRF